MAALESAIQHLHGLGWTQNDLTPANILVSEAGVPVLIDRVPVPIPHFLTTAHIPGPVDKTTPHMTPKK